MKEIQAIFFDFDGVILESVDVKGWAFGKLFEDYPDHVDEIVAYHYANGGVSRFDKIRYFYEQLIKKSLSEDHFEELCNKFSNLVFDRVLSCEFVPGAQAYLEAIHKKCLSFVVSGAPHQEIIEITNQKNLSHYFVEVCGSPTKKETWVNALMSKYEIDPQKALFVGDAMSDYEAARINGITFVARVNATNKRVFKGIDMDLEVSDLAQLLKLWKDGDHFTVQM